MKWRPMSEAPRDGTKIVGWCVHDADPYHVSDTKLTTYGAHAEGLGHVEDGPNVLEWGGEYHEEDHEAFNPVYIPAWWFRCGSNYEEVANPTHWLPLPEPPKE